MLLMLQQYFKLLMKDNLYLHEHEANTELCLQKQSPLTMVITGSMFTVSCIFKYLLE